MLAVGPQPSVIRAGIAGSLASLAWLTGRLRDAWYALLLGGDRACSPGTRTWSTTRAFSSRSPLSWRSSRSSRDRPAGSRVARFRARLASGSRYRSAAALVTAPILWLAVRLPAAARRSRRTRSPSRRCRCSSVSPSSPRASLVALPSAAAVVAWLNGWVGRLHRALRARRSARSRLRRSGTRAPRRAAAALLLVVVGRSMVRTGPERASVASARRLRRSISPAPMLGCDGGRAQAGVPDRRNRPPEDRSRRRAAPRPLLGGRDRDPPAPSRHRARTQSPRCNALGLFAGDGRLIVVEASRRGRRPTRRRSPPTSGRPRRRRRSRSSAVS